MANKDPWLPAPFQQLSQEVDRLFDELIYRPWGISRAQEAAWAPQLDLYEDASEFILEADVPGVRQQDISVTVENNNLILRGKRAFERVCSEESFYCRERRSGEFVRQLRLPATVDKSQIRAEFQDGVLRVTLPKIRTERKSQQ